MVQPFQNEVLYTLTYSGSDIVDAFFLDDLPEVKIPASRIVCILGKINLSNVLSNDEQDFLRRSGCFALLQFSNDGLNMATCRMKAQKEQQHRIKAKAVAREKTIRELAINMREKEMLRRQKVCELSECFAMPPIKSADVARIDSIIASVDGGKAINSEDLVWLGTGGKVYWTVKLRIAHHTILAKSLSADWHRTSDAWKAVNACGNWRKAQRPEDGLAIAESALKKTTTEKVKVGSALLTTAGGALRDLGHRESAKDFGEEAHILTPQDFRPCTLLGAINIEIGAYSTGAEWYEKAEERGAKANLIDRELRSILNAADPTERNLIKKELKGYDASRYSRF